MATAEGQQHPIAIYLWIWLLLFVFSAFSYGVDYFQLQGYLRNKKMVVVLMVATAMFGASFVGMQAFEWTKLIEEGVRPWGNPMGAAQFGSCFFMITGFHGLHVSIGVIYVSVVAFKVGRGDYENRGYEIVEITGLYWHFVDLVWVFIFAFFYLW